VDIDNKLNNYLKIAGIINNTIRPRVTFKITRIKLDTTPVLSTLLYSSENWTTVAQDARRITPAEIKYMRKTAGYTWTDYKTNTEIAKELNITPVLDKIQDHRKKWLQLTNRRPQRLPRIITPQTKQQKKPGQTTKESRRVRQERVNKWSNTMLAR